MRGPSTLVSQGEKCGNALHLVRRQFLEHLLITYLGEARYECLERLSGFLPHGVEVNLHTMLLVRTGEVRSEPRTELLPGLNRPRSEVHDQVRAGPAKAT